jgi:hypothetical protein
LQQAEMDENFMKVIITVDEMWVNVQDDKMKQQSSRWMAKLSLWPRKAKQSRLNLKIMLNIFFSCCGLVQYKFIPSSQTVNQEFYLTIFMLSTVSHSKGMILCQEHSWFLDHNIPTQAVLSPADSYQKKT